MLDILHAFPGWTWEYVEEFITVPRVNALVTYWAEECPPACRALAAFVGFKPRPKVVSTEQSAEENERAAEVMMKMFPQKRTPPKRTVPTGAANG